MGYWVARNGLQNHKIYGIGIQMFILYVLYLFQQPPRDNPWPT
jgi:hypothetical protein